MPVDDLWYLAKAGPAGERIPSKRHGRGKRYRVRYYPDGPGAAPKTRLFERKAAAENFDAAMRTDIGRGDYIDPDAGKVTFRAFAPKWLDASGMDVATREGVEGRLRLHILPTFGEMPLRAILPSTITTWFAALTKKGLGAHSRRLCFAHLQGVLSLAEADGLIRRNPCTAKVVQERKPVPHRRKIQAWPAEWVGAVHGAILDRYGAAVLLGSQVGHRQGEAFAASPEDVDWFRCVVSIRRQVKWVSGRPHFALPKRGKVRQVPVAPEVRDALAAHLTAFPAIPVTLPWHGEGHKGETLTVPLIVTNSRCNVVWRSTFNAEIWKPALRRAGVPDTRENGFHALRHMFASAMLARGVSITELSEYLGHSDEGFTLRTYTHFLPDSEGRARTAASEAFRAIFQPSSGSDRNVESA